MQKFQLLGKYGARKNYDLKQQLMGLVSEK